MRLLLVSIICLLLAACSTFTQYPGYYSIKAYDTNGKKIDTINTITDGSGIYRTINSYCLAFPQAKLVIKNTKTQKELSELSPFQCKGKRNS